MTRVRRVSIGSLLACMAFVLALAAACGDDNDAQTAQTAQAASSPAASAPAATTVSGKITVFAAASLTDAFDEVADGFKAANPGASVEFNFAGSPALVTQIEQGAPADILATADQTNMDDARERDLVSGAGVSFAKNRLAIIVPKSNPGRIASPNDLAKPGLKLVLAQADVPVGNYARQVLDKFSADPAHGAGFSADVLANLVSEEPNVKSVVTKVQLGEADAGVVYVTDVTAGVAEDVTLVEIPDEFNVIAAYPIAITKDAGSPEVAQAFIDYLLSPEGQAVLQKHGFASAAS